jgi:hypothetical protein
VIPPIIVNPDPEEKDEDQQAIEGNADGEIH